MTSLTTSGPLLQRQPVIGPLEAFRQIDLAVVAEVGIALAGLRVQRDQVGADVGDDARVAAVGPVGEAARGRAARRSLAVGPRRQRVEPQRLAGRRIERRDGADGGAHVEQAVHHQRRVLIVGRRLRVRESGRAAPRASPNGATRSSGS